MIRSLLLSIIRVYQAILSPMLGPSCRFHPTCSTYAYNAILKYGTVGGSFLALRRILRCNPFNKGGYDPVP